MKKVYSRFLIFAVILSMAVSEGYSEDQTGENVWKYNVKNFNQMYSEAVNASEDASLRKKDLNEVLPDLLNYMGEQGWELCAYISEGERFVFKRNSIVPAKSNGR